ncbi:MAG: hypothetical protein GTO45_10675 [Candidatus Aminicenantes bacterium]|nr:hypothetical protein [Candidatus Aminicenantes bacterium]NIM79271.1 hypothetical protein [Candidatus Aminicenantes bacterium]NIN18557.1 hypothetical protein [Candidatus Aminicenantes bacterium]NIN42454.1 hypothetical protein [Candidatus Aminicenantes bacterium]NIN85212.1 hypothetical protein [Candidatus Aminicenantes bacterium]
MHKKILLLIIVVPFCIGWTSNPVRNTAVCTADHEQKRPQLVSDGDGGAFVVWEDSRSGSDYDIYGQLIDSAGRSKWRAGGISICTAIGAQRYPQVAADSSGGFIITWFDRRNGRNYDIYAQRINGEGRIQWTANGVAICTAVGDQYDPMPVSDGTGGAFIVWQDRRNGNDYDIYAQRIDSSGRVQWDADGVGICTEKQDQDNLQAAADEKGGVVITWQDRRNGKDYDIYARRIDSSGRVQWRANGVEICTAEYDQRGPRLVSDTMGGAVFTWQDKRNGSDYDIYTQRIDSSGRVQWTANGIAICAAANSQYDPRLASDGKGGAYITWQDYRKGSDCNFDAFEEQTNFNLEICREKHLNDWNIYAQLINSSGRVQWAANGVGISTANIDQYKPQMAADGFGGTIVVWRAAEKENDHNIYAQRLTSSGKVQWTADGITVSSAPGDQYDPLLVSDGSGGAVVTWYDKRKGNNWDIYAQKLCASGRIGDCPPRRPR